MTSAQRRKMKGYGDFKRIAVVIIPDDEKYKERCESQAANEKGVFSDNAINDMKGKRSQLNKNYLFYIHSLIVVCVCIFITYS